MNRPVINHISFLSEADCEWHTRTFLPLFSDELAWAEDVKCPQFCSLSNHPHPMVRDEQDEHHKLCTLTVIRAGLVTREEITGKKRREHEKG